MIEERHSLGVEAVAVSCGPSFNCSELFPRREDSENVVSRVKRVNKYFAFSLPGECIVSGGWASYS